MTNEETIKQNLFTLTTLFVSNQHKKNDCVVLEKNENSFLVPFCKESTKEFFRGIFSENGPFWEAYNEMGLGEMPKDKQYSVFINDELYFCKNIEEQYVYSIGPKSKFVYKKGKLLQTKPLSLDYAIRSISAPFDILSQTKQTILDAFRINEIIPQIKTQLDESKTYWEKNKDKEDFDINDVEYSLEKAIKCMKYSFFASLAYSLKLRPSDQIAPIIEETIKIHESIKQFQKGGKSTFDVGYFGENIYDISSPRFFDNLTKTNEFEVAELPKDNWMILRETLKIVCARYLAVQRKAELKIGKKVGLDENIFYLSTKEIMGMKEKSVDETVRLVGERKYNFQENSKMLLPNKIIFFEKWFFLEETNQNTLLEIVGTPVGSNKTVKGIASIVKNDLDLKKDFEGKIIVTSYFSPNLVITYKSALGVISSVGGALSHPAIVAREKDLPCIVQTNISSIKEGDEIELNGEKGIFKIIKKK